MESWPDYFQVFPFLIIFLTWEKKSVDIIWNRESEEQVTVDTSFPIIIIPSTSLAPK